MFIPLLFEIYRVAKMLRRATHADLYGLIPNLIVEDTTALLCKEISDWTNKM